MPIQDINEIEIFNESFPFFFGQKEKKEKKPTDVSFKEKLLGYIGEKVIIDDKNKRFIIKGINYDKFYLRLKEMYNYKGIANLFEKKYSAWSEFLFNKEKITKTEMKIVNIEVPLFFALEIYRIFLDLDEFYNLPYYTKVANNIYKKTWISNFERCEMVQTNTSTLSNFSYELKNYQLEYVREYEYIKAKYNLIGDILSFEQGLGKTLTAIAVAECLNKKQIIIICPNSLRDNWAYEIKDYYKKYNMDEDAWINDIWVNNSNKFISKNPRFIITNQEAIEKIYDKISKSKDSIIIVDEFQNFRNINSLRVQKLLKLKEMINCKDNLLLSGTPIKATPDEIIPALRMIDPYFTPEMAEIYDKSFSNSGVEIARVVKERFGRIIYRKTKQEVLTLPNKYIHTEKWGIRNDNPYLLKTVSAQIFERFNFYYTEKLKSMEVERTKFEPMVRRYSSAGISMTNGYLSFIYSTVDPTKETIELHEHREEIYKTFLNDYVYPNISNEATKKALKETATKYVYLKQSAFGKAIGEILPKAKTNCYLDIIDNNADKIIDLIKNSIKKTVIFTPFLEVANYTEAFLKKNKIGCVKIIGGTNDRMDKIVQFKGNDDIEVLVATVQTLSTGVTLTEANQMLFFGTPYRKADFDQACDRIHRIGQTQDVDIYVILLRSSEKNITDRIEEIMNWSGELTDSIIGEETMDKNIDVVTAESFLQNFVNEAKMPAAERNKLKDSDFGLPEQRKYPLSDVDHVKDAIKFFNFCKKEDEEELAKNLKKAIKKYNLDDQLEANNRNRFYKYYTPKKSKEKETEEELPKAANESAELELVDEGAIKDFVKKIKDKLTKKKSSNINDKASDDFPEFLKDKNETKEEAIKVLLDAFKKYFENHKEEIRNKIDHNMNNSDFKLDFYQNNDKLPEVYIDSTEVDCPGAFVFILADKSDNDDQGNIFLFKNDINKVAEMLDDGSDPSAKELIDKYKVRIYTFEDPSCVSIVVDSALTKADIDKINKDKENTIATNEGFLSKFKRKSPDKVAGLFKEFEKYWNHPYRLTLYDKKDSMDTYFILYMLGKLKISNETIINRIISINDSLSSFEIKDAVIKDIKANCKSSITDETNKVLNAPLLFADGDSTEEGKEQGWFIIFSKEARELYMIDENKNTMEKYNGTMSSRWIDKLNKEFHISEDDIKKADAESNYYLLQNAPAGTQKNTINGFND